MFSETTIPVEGGSMPLVLAMPEGAGPFPAVVVAHHREGIDGFTRAVGDRLAQNGFLAVLVDFYHRRPAGEDTHVSRQHLTDGEIVADIAAVVAALQAMPEIRGGALAILGHCLGGRLAYLGAATNRAFKAAVILYGGGILRGEGEGRPAPIDLSGAIGCPVLGFFGKEDKGPSPADVAAIDAALTRHKVRHELHSYDGAGHAFQNFTDARFRPAASEDAWTRLIAFLRAELQIR